MNGTKSVHKTPSERWPPEIAPVGIPLIFWAQNGNESNRFLIAFNSLGLDPREILNAIFYLLKGGVQWRMIPDGFPPWQTVYYHFRKWRRLNLFQRLCDRLRRAARVSEGRKPSPSAAVVDTQSVSTTRQGGPGRGRDPNKQVKGRKRHVITDTLGLLLGVLVHPANESDGQSLPHLPGEDTWARQNAKGNLRRQRL
ncbi:IS5 family transposase [Salinibacter ruber]|uniref:IS5 family transposase n=1 Tax=Salinibacter ruber TaxID=146919 RepID=UPI000E5812FD